MNKNGLIKKFQGAKKNNNIEFTNRNQFLLVKYFFDESFIFHVYLVLSCYILSIFASDF